MPFYEYECRACGHQLEAMQKISDKPLRKCPECGKSSLTKLVSAPIFRLKGGGWYETDFKSEQDKKRNLAGEATPPAEAKGDAKTESKVESKSDAKADAKADAKPASGASDKSPAAKSSVAKSSAGKSTARTRSTSKSTAGAARSRRPAARR